MSGDDAWVELSIEDHAGVGTTQAHGGDGGEQLALEPLLGVVPGGHFVAKELQERHRRLHLGRVDKDLLHVGVANTDEADE